VVSVGPKNPSPAKNARISANVEFRVGIHLGDVVEEGDGDLMGDGVNIASRLEGVSKPGSICLSEDAYRQVKSGLDLKVTDLGPLPLKNIAEPMRAYSLEVGQPAQAKPVSQQVKSPQQGEPTVPPHKPRVLGLHWPAIAAALAIALLAAGAYAWHVGYAPRFMVASVDDSHPVLKRLDDRQHHCDGGRHHHAHHLGHRWATTDMT
jgi:hypothetical protein